MVVPGVSGTTTVMSRAGYGSCARAGAAAMAAASASAPSTTMAPTTTTEPEHEGDNDGDNDGDSGQSVSSGSTPGGPGPSSTSDGGSNSSGSGSGSGDGGGHDAREIANAVLNRDPFSGDTRPGQRLPDPEQDLERLVGLEHPQDAGHDAEHAGDRAARGELRRRRRRIEAAVARPRERDEGR